MKRIIFIASTASLMIFAGCKLLDATSNIATSALVATGAISNDQKKSIDKVASTAGKLFDQLTPENEYWIGRSVTASILQKYKPYNNAKANHYMNVLGQTLALASDRPETFGGYHFQILDTDEINAFAAPGGLILVTRGLIRCCKSEDALAAVLAHEVGHVQLLHGLKAISSSRFKDTFFVTAIELGKNAGGEQIAQAVNIFEGTLDDITDKLLNGYTSSQEYEADAAAVTIMSRIGYNPVALKEMLTQMQAAWKKGFGFGKTHPEPADRIMKIESSLKNYGSVEKPSARQARFEKAMAGV